MDGRRLIRISMILSLFVLKERVRLNEKKGYLFFKLNSIWSMWPLINDLIIINIDITLNKIIK